MAVDFCLDGNLFNIRRLQATSKLQRERVIELQYADDCALVSHSPQDLQSVLTAVVRAYSRMGLTVNTIKTEVVCQWSTNIPSTPPIFTVAGEQLSVVPSFRYLGSILPQDNTIDSEVQNKIKQASAAFGRLRRWVLQNKNLHLHTKVSVYQAICITTLLYSCESWVTYSRHIRALEQFHIAASLDGTRMMEEDRTARRRERRLRRNTPAASAATTTTFTCPTCNRTCGSRIGLHSHQRTHR